VHRACESANAVRTVASLTREADVTRLYSAELDEPQRRTIRFSLWGNLVRRPRWAIRT
jgi:ATP-binding cassette subfamily B (MDR/TAP) protein 1